MADQIRRRITRGELRPGQKLESERRLARELQVSMPILREGISALSYLGLVEVRHGVGVFVRRRLPAARLVSVARRHAGRGELHSLRTALGAESARRAASRRQPARKYMDLALFQSERRLAGMSGDPEKFARADTEFHAYLAGMSGSALHAAVDRLIGIGVSRDLAAHAKRLALDDELGDLHADLVDAIEQRRPDAAATAATAIGLRESPDAAEAEAADAAAR